MVRIVVEIQSQSVRPCFEERARNLRGDEADLQVCREVGIYQQKSSRGQTGRTSTRINDTPEEAARADSSRVHSHSGTVSSARKAGAVACGLARTARQ